MCEVRIDRVIEDAPGSLRLVMSKGNLTQVSRLYFDPAWNGHGVPQFKYVGKLWGQSAAFDHLTEIGNTLKEAH